MTTATTTIRHDRHELIAEANAKRKLADQAHKAGDAALRDAYLRQAADHYRVAGQGGLAAWCERFIGK